MKYIVVFFIKIYQLTLSPIFKSLTGNGCRYLPTCSEYGSEAILKYGIFKGSVLTAKRISRCHPFSKHKSVYDPLI